MKKITTILKITLIVCLVAFATSAMIMTTQAKPKYVISPKSKPINNWQYGKKNHHYVLLRSILKKLEKKHGGTIVLKKGKYTISNTLYVPSNVTIKFKKGVKLIKGKKTGTSQYKASNTMFQFVRDSKQKKKNFTKKYKGEKNIKFIGAKGVTIDMKNFNSNGTKEIGIVMANNKNVVFKNITFKNVKMGHIIEMDGCKNVSFQNCTFKNMKDNKYHNKEAVNIDTNDKKNNAFSQKWSKADKTPNYNIKFNKCKFENLVRGIGTHQYSENKYHTKIKITNCKFIKCKTPLGIINWKDLNVTNNTMKNCKSNSRYDYTILMAGAKNPTFTKNVFDNCKSADVIKFYYRYQTSHHTYPYTYSELSKANIKDLANNKAINGTKKYFDAKDYGRIKFSG